MTLNKGILYFLKSFFKFTSLQNYSLLVRHVMKFQAGTQDLNLAHKSHDVQQGMKILLALMPGKCLCRTSGNVFAHCNIMFTVYMYFLLLPLLNRPICISNQIKLM